MRHTILWLRLLLRWWQILLGRSYYHQAQGVGKAFKPGELEGYFNDLTGKTKWNGETDIEGIPLNTLINGRKIYFATTIVQKALGHWDCWLLNEDEFHKKEFLKLCHWLIIHQDENGGWPLWTETGLNFSSPYSAMTQGECISAFVRAWKITGNPDFASCAEMSLKLLLKPVEEGGTAIYDGDNLFLEELPLTDYNSILNGWVFALFGLYDFWLAFNDENAKNAFLRSLKTLKKYLPYYDCGYWSYYDLNKNLASSFYHNLHISQLFSLSMIDDDPVILEYRNRWIKYHAKLSNRFKAFIVKSIQKLQSVGEGVISK